MSWRPGPPRPSVVDRHRPGVCGGVQGERCRPEAYLLVCRRTNPERPCWHSACDASCWAPSPSWFLRPCSRCAPGIPCRCRSCAGSHSTPISAWRRAPTTRPCRSRSSTSTTSRSPASANGPGRARRWPNCSTGSRSPAPRRSPSTWCSPNRIAARPKQALKLWPKTLEVLALRDSVAVLPSHDSILAEAIEQAPVVTGFVLTNDERTAVAAGHAAPQSAANLVRDPLAAPVLSDALDGELGALPGSRAPAPKATFATAGDDPARFVRRFSSAVANLSELEAGATGNGALNSAPDVDQVLRRVPLVLALDDQLYPSLAAEALRVAQGAGTNVVKSSGASAVPAFGEHTGVSVVRIGEFEIPTDPQGRMWLHFSKHDRARLYPRVDRARGRLRSRDRCRPDRVRRDQRSRSARHPRHTARCRDSRRRDSRPGDRADPVRRFPQAAGLRRRHGTGVHAGARPDRDRACCVRSARSSAWRWVAWPRCWCSPDRGCRSMSTAGCSIQCSRRSWCCWCSPPRKASRTRNPRRNGGRYAAPSSNTSRRSWSTSWRGIPSGCASAASSAR